MTFALFSFSGLVGTEVGMEANDVFIEKLGLKSDFKFNFMKISNKFHLKGAPGGSLGLS